MEVSESGGDHIGAVKLKRRKDSAAKNKLQISPNSSQMNTRGPRLATMDSTAASRFYPNSNKDAMSALRKK